MKQFIVALALVFLTSTSAQAGRVVMSFSDSRGGTGTTTSIPALVDSQRTDFVVCNKYKNGRNSVTGLAEFDQAYIECSALGDVTDVIILLGVNDMLAGNTSVTVATNLRTLAGRASSYFAVPWVVLEMPGPIAWGGYTFMDARKYTRDNIDEFLKINVAPKYNTINLRDELLVTGWYGSSNCSSDSLHPTLQSCRQSLANAVSNAVP